MPEIDPATYDAIDHIIEEKKEASEWDPDAMRSALIDVAGGSTQSDAAEEREGISQAQISKRWSDVQEAEKEIQKRSEEGSGLFPDPMEQAIEEFKDFFDELNAKYNMGIRDRAVQMMVDEIRDSQQLPRPMYVDQFLRGTNSGVSGKDVDYIKRRYDSWLQNQDFATGAGQQSSGMPGGGMAGQQIAMGGGNQHPQQQQGIPIQSQDPWGNQPQQGPSNRQAPSQQQPPQGDPRVDALREQVENLAETVKEAVEGDGGGGNDEYVTITQDDGTQVEMPLDQAVQMGYIGGDDDGEDFLDQLQKAKQAGLIPSEDDLRDDGPDLMDQLQKFRELGLIDDDSEEQMAEAIQTAISDLGEKQLQAQQQMSQNMSQVMEQMREAQEEEEDISLEDVEDIIEDKLTKSEVEQVQEQMENRFNQLQSELQKTKRREGGSEHSEEYLKTDREMEFREKQLETLNENLKEIPQAVAASVQKGLVPAIKELEGFGGEGGSGLWQPPETPRRGRPDYDPESDPTAAARRRAEQQGQQRRQPRQPQRDGEYPQAGDVQEQEQADLGQDEPGGVTEERANELRGKLGLDDDGETAEAQA